MRPQGRTVLHENAVAIGKATQPVKDSDNSRPELIGVLEAQPLCVAVEEADLNEQLLQHVDHPRALLPSERQIFQQLMRSELPDPDCRSVKCACRHGHGCDDGEWRNALNNKNELGIERASPSDGAPVAPQAQK